MTEPKDISGIDDIRWLVDRFYDKIKGDELLAPVFSKRIPDAMWPQHLQIMYNFWASVLLAQNTYHGNPFPKHTGLAIEAIHFDRWVRLFHETIDLYFSGPKAEEAKAKSMKIRSLFESKLQFMAGGGPKPLV